MFEPHGLASHSRVQCVRPERKTPSSSCSGGQPRQFVYQTALVQGYSIMNQPGTNPFILIYSNAGVGECWWPVSFGCFSNRVTKRRTTHFSFGHGGLQRAPAQSFSQGLLKVLSVGESPQVEVYRENGRDVWSLVFWPFRGPEATALQVTPASDACMCFKWVEISCGEKEVAKLSQMSHQLHKAKIQPAKTPDCLASDAKDPMRWSA